MSRRILTVDTDKCGGCRTCELICSWSHNKGIFRTAVSRIHVFKEEALGIEFPVVCQQCEEAACMGVCPADAISKDTKTAAAIINPDICVGCKACMMVCPYGAIGFDSSKRVMLKCDLCQGDPQCVKWCPRDALRYETAEISNLLRQRTIMEERIAKPMIEAAKAIGMGQPTISLSIATTPKKD